MAITQKTLKTCDQGHRYYKSSDCPTCPVCEQERKPDTGFLSRLSNPARQALEHAGIMTLQQLSTHTERDILRLHGMGPRSLPILREALQAQGLSFRQPAEPKKTRAAKSGGNLSEERTQ